MMHRKRIVRLTGRPDMTLDVYRGHKKKHNNIVRRFQNFISDILTQCLNIMLD